MSLTTCLRYCIVKEILILYRTMKILKVPIPTIHIFRYMYVGDQDLKKILRYKLDGSERTVLDDTNILWPNQLAISYTLR